MSSDDTDFNPDALEALSAKEEYDSEPSSTSSDSDGEANDSEAEKRREERKTKKEEKAKRAAKRSASKSGGGEKKERKSKRTKLPGQPKRPMSAYFLWMNESREQIKKDHPGLSIAEFGKKAGELWKSMTDKSVRFFFLIKIVIFLIYLLLVNFFLKKVFHFCYKKIPTSEFRTKKNHE